MSDSYFDWLASHTVRPYGPGERPGGNGSPRPPQNVGVNFAFDSIDGDSMFAARIMVRNQGTRNVARWRLEFDFAAKVTDVSGAKLVSVTGKHYTLGNVDSDATIPAGGSAQVRVRGILVRLDARPENYTWNGIRVSYQQSNPTGTALRAQLQRLLATRPPPLSACAPGDDGSAGRTEQEAGGLERHDRLITFGLELPRQAIVTEKQDRILLQERVRHCIKRHMPWAAGLAVVATQDRDEDAGRTVVSVQVRVSNASDNGSLELTLDRLVRDVELIDLNARAQGGRVGSGE